jgi:CII-binding regulator of phage lambda lysogenization HflD
MTSILTDDEKAAIIDSHKKNIAYNQYNLSITLVEENAKSNPDKDTVASLTDQIKDVQLQIDALDKERATLTTTPPASN